MTLVPLAVGRLIGRQIAPNVSRSAATTPGRSTSGASILFTTSIRGIFRSSATAISFRAVLSIPFTASITTTTVSAAGKHAMACPTKSGRPGVSITCTSCPSYSKCTNAGCRLCL